ncbi:MAG: restriction endonuclease subunit S [Anaerolineaceae bacterium]|nr:restriction endonuclease subunit S [Anaerolineaceae bacterium]
MSKRNENRPGYEETKIGWIPSDWQAIKLKDIGEFSKGAGITKADLLLEGLPAIRYGEIYTTHHYIVKRFYSYISSEVASTSHKISKGDILFAGSGETREEIGKCVAYTKEEVAYAGGDIILLRLILGNPAFWGYCLNSSIVNHQKFKLGQGHSVVHIYSSLLKDLIVQFPPIPEQRKIADILSTWDRAIELAEKQIKAKQRLKKGLMQQLLTGKMRFPGFEEEWKEYKVGNIADLTAGGTPSTRIPEYWNGNIRWMKSGDIHQKRIFEVENRITQKGLDNSSAKMLPVNSVLIALAGQGKTRGTVAINKVELSTNQSVAAIIPDEEYISFEFLYYILDSRYEELRRLSTGDGGRGGLNLKLLRSIKLLAPFLEEQKRIVYVLVTIEHGITKLEEKVIALNIQKQGLMQKLLTGEVRVRE